MLYTPVMRIRHLLPLLSLVLLLSACAAPEPNPGDGNVGAACKTAEECETPMSYLVRSHCPFGSACVDGACAVVCPMPAEGAKGWSQPLACIRNEDCDCDSYAATDRKNCRCIDGTCVAVMEREKPASPR